MNMESKAILHFSFERNGKTAKSITYSHCHAMPFHSIPLSLYTLSSLHQTISEFRIRAKNIHL